MPVLDESAARTASGTGASVFEHGTRGAYFLVDVTARSGTSPTMVVKVQYTIDGVTWHDLDTTNAATASITATGQSLLRVYPGIANTANVSCNAALPNRFRLAWTLGGTNPSFTFSTAADYVL